MFDTNIKLCIWQSYVFSVKCMSIIGFLLLFHSFSYTFAAQKNKKTFDAVNSGRVF